MLPVTKYHFIDVNECLAGDSGCGQICNNFNGSYQCSCENGYELTSDGHSCTGM